MLAAVALVTAPYTTFSVGLHGDAESIRNLDRVSGVDAESDVVGDLRTLAGELAA